MTAQLPTQAGPALQLRLWQRFHMRLTLLYGGAVFLVLGTMSAFFYTRTVRAQFEGLQGRLRGVAVALADGIKPEWIAALQKPEDAQKPEYKEIVRRFQGVAKAEPELSHLYIFAPIDKPGWLRFVVSHVIYSKHGMPAAAISRPYDATKLPNMWKALREPTVEDDVYDDEWGPVISGYAPIAGEDGKGVAFVGCDVTAESLTAMKRHVLLVALALFGLAAVLVSAVSAFVARNVREPLTRIIEAATAIAAGKLDVRTQLVRRDEFGILGHHFDEMAVGLQEREFIRDTFGRYMSKDVAKKLLSSKEAGALGGEERNVTVLFSDIRGYSTISEHLTPKQVIDLLNEYLAGMNEIIDKHGGCVIEFLGDGILTVFNAPGELDGHPAHAVRCAIEMRERLHLLNKELAARGLASLWQSRGLPDLASRIGIHTGAVVAGNMGSKVRVKYAVIGDTVNVASRCEGLNKQFGTEILWTQEVHDLLPEDLKAQATSRGAHPVKGREQLVSVYSV